jgi:putative transposase
VIAGPALRRERPAEWWAWGVTGAAVDLIRESVRMVLQELIETEASDVIGAARYERTDSRVNQRNGSRPRILATQAGDIDLWIPKLRKGSFFPLTLEPRRRIDQALYAVVMEAYVAGCPRGLSMTWSPRRASTRASPSPRSRVSAADWTRS